MTCRHAKGDPNCSSSPQGAAREVEYRTKLIQDEDKKRVAMLEAQLAAAQQASPDSEKFEITQVAVVGENLVLKVQYPNCSKCTYEGSKVMVFLGVSTLDALKWRRIDPHFRGDPLPKVGQRFDSREAPPPAARFPGSDEGWRDAVAYAVTKKGDTPR